MKSAVENLNPTRVRLTVEVPFEELKPSLDAVRTGRRGPGLTRCCGWMERVTGIEPA